MPTIQTLLVPEVVELPPQDAAEAADSLEELSVYGFEVEPFGKASFRINGVISTWQIVTWRELLGNLCHEGYGSWDEQGAEDPRHHSVPLCGKAWRQTLLPGDGGADQEWLSSRYPATCPHGRSICYRLDHKDIARKLDRH